jgi:hypothetical protein
MNQEELQRKIAYQKALRDSGKRFIRLRLINMYTARIMAIDSLVPIFGIGEHGLLTVTLQDGSRELEFEPNESNTDMIADVLDTPFNRKFLASHTAYNYWEIEDPDIRREIEEMADEITRKSIINKKVIAPPERRMSNLEIDNEIARLQREKLNRQLADSPIAPLADEELPEEPVEEETPEQEPVQRPRHAKKAKGRYKNKGIPKKPTVQEEPMVTVET